MSSKVVPVLLLLIFLSLNYQDAAARKHWKPTNIKIINNSDRNLKIHCQSILTDLYDQFVYTGEDFAFNFHDFDPDNHHFWCDAYGLENFFETFDVFGKGAPKSDNVTWYLHQDGLYMDGVLSEHLHQPWRGFALSS